MEDLRIKNKLTTATYTSAKTAALFFSFARRIRIPGEMIHVHREKWSNKTCTFGGNVQ